MPESLRHPDGDWYAVTKRARVVMYRKADVDVTGLERYEDLADPTFCRHDLHPFVQQRL